jgi:hypothetical protein
MATEDLQTRIARAIHDSIYADTVEGAFDALDPYSVHYAAAMTQAHAVMGVVTILDGGEVTPPHQIPPLTIVSNNDDGGKT